MPDTGQILEMESGAVSLQPQPNRRARQKSLRTMMFGCDVAEAYALVADVRFWAKTGNRSGANAEGSRARIHAIFSFPARFAKERWHPSFRQSSSLQFHRMH
jgi:hypothetical protein